MAIVGDVHEREELVIEWTIRNFFSLSSEVKTYHSPKFFFGGVGWRLRVCPHGQKEKDSEGCIDLYLMRTTDGPPIHMEYSFGCIKSNNKIEMLKDYEFTFKGALHYHGSIHLIKRSEFLARKSDYFADHLTWVCQMKPPKFTDVPSDNSTSGSVVTNDILEELKDVFLNQKNCDVSLRVQGRKFQAHSVILAARSPVFASLFQNDMKGKSTHVFDIEDCNPSFFSDFLCFLYCNDAERFSEENVMSLLATADKYAVYDLRTKCLEFLEGKFSFRTFGNSIASPHSETEPTQLAAA